MSGDANATATGLLAALPQFRAGLAPHLLMVWLNVIAQVIALRPRGRH